MTQIVLHNQSLLDFCLHHTGTLNSLFEITVKNNISITDDLIAGQELEIPDNVTVDKDILNYYKAKNIKPATALTDKDKAILEKLEGISYWAIGIDFKVS